MIEKKEYNIDGTRVFLPKNRRMGAGKKLMINHIIKTFQSNGHKVHTVFENNHKDNEGVTYGYTITFELPALKRREKDPVLRAREERQHVGHIRF
jgi:hypothetical protein